MDLSIARNRIASVLKPDSITATQGDFLVTHVPLKRLHLLNKFELQPSDNQCYSEEEVYSQCILNPMNKHQFIAVYGQSGTGKSHLIRWFEARFENDKLENEVVLFIRRSDNTLKGTIRQLLEKPEVQGIANKAVYDRLVRAAVAVEPAKLKDLIYHNFIVEIENDNDDTRAIQLNNSTKKRLESFLKNDIVQEHLLGVSGPIERMYSKVAENALVDQDTIAEFVPDDFLVSPDFFENISSNGADSKAERMARKLMSDEEGFEEARKIAGYLNQFVNDVIQRCAGIEPSDFRQIFQDIRCELYRLGKNLTLFIEDVTSFTGVDDALLDALIVEHTGMNAGAQMCRISSIVGTTSNYLQNNFRDNHKDRITNLVYIPSDVFDEKGIYEFVGRYLNAMSLTEAQINSWLANRALPSEYPVHTVKEGKEWDTISLDAQTQLSLYPFSKAAIRYLYQNSLTKGHQTPRYMIREMIEPVMNDLLNNHDNFPSDFCPLIGVNNALNQQIHSQIKDVNIANRMLRFLTIWGNGQPERESDGVTTYFARIKESIIAELGFPKLSGETVQIDSAENGSSLRSSELNVVAVQQSSVSPESQNKMAAASSVLTDWINGANIDVSSTGGTSGILNRALSDLNAYLRTVINWLAEGVSNDDVEKAVGGTKKILVLERQVKGSGYYTLPANWTSKNLLEALIRWREFGKQSWRYPESDYDLYQLSLWTFQVKNDVIHAVKETEEKNLRYIEAAIIGEIYQQILTGEYGEKTLRNFTYDRLFTYKDKSVKNSNHAREWINFCNVLQQGSVNEKNRETVRKYFDLPQGVGGSKIVLDEPRISTTFHKIKQNKLHVSDADLNTQDSAPQRQAPYVFLKTILDRVDNVANAEIEKAQPLMDQIAQAFQLDADEPLDEETLNELFNDANRFYAEANNNQINIPVTATDALKKAVKQTVKTYKDVQSVLDTDDTLSILMAFSSDPITLLQNLTAFLTQLSSSIQKANVQISSRIAQLTESEDIDQLDNPYADALNEISEATELLEGGGKCAR